MGGRCGIGDRLLEVEFVAVAHHIHPLHQLSRPLGHQIESLLEDGTLKPLPLKEGRRRTALLYLMFSHPDSVGPATRQLADIFVQSCQV